MQAVIEEDGWIALVFDLLDGHNLTLPWRRNDLDRVVAALQQQFAVLTPSPIDVAPASDTFAVAINGFGRLQALPPAGLDACSRRHLDRLADLEAHAPDASRGETLLHLDVRADNIVLTPDRVYIVDWYPHRSPYRDGVCCEIAGLDRDETGETRILSITTGVDRTGYPHRNQLRVTGRSARSGGGSNRPRRV